MAGGTLTQPASRVQETGPPQAQTHLLMLLLRLLCFFAVQSLRLSVKLV